MIYCVSLLAVIVSEPTVMAGGVGMARGEVVRILAPAAPVVVSMMAGRRTVEERTMPWALVEVVVLGRNAETEAVERLVERTVLP